MPTQSNIKDLCTDRFNWLEKDLCMFQSKGRFLLLGDLMPGWVKLKMYMMYMCVIGMFGKNASNTNVNLLI